VFLRERLHRRLVCFCLCTFFCNSPLVAWAHEPSALRALTGKDLNQLTGLAAYGFNVGGWATPDLLTIHHILAIRSNGTVQFNNRANEFQLYQLGLFLEKPLQRGMQNCNLAGVLSLCLVQTPQTTRPPSLG